MDAEIQKELEELQNLPEAELDETQQNRLNELNQEAEAEKTAEQSKELQSALAQKDHFREKAEKAQKDFDEYKSKHPETELPAGTPKEDVEIWEASNDPLEIVKFNKVLKDYDEAETEFIMQNSPTRNLEGIMKAVENPMVQAAIQGMRDKAEAENKVPPPSSPSSTVKVVDAEKAVRDGTVAEDVAERYKKLEESGTGEGL